jgi:uncharacterized MnhB-related membrane protein
MWFILIGVGILVCSFLAVTTRRLLISAIWLAVTSALVAVIIFLLGAAHIAVIELSVGAGLVTVLFVFAINISGEEPGKLKSLVPKPIAIVFIVIAVGLVIYLVLKAVGIVQFPTQTAIPSTLLWRDRYLDFILQVVLIFSGVLGVIGILADRLPEHQKEDAQ